MKSRICLSPPHLGDYERIFKICEAYDVPVVVDAAEAMGARYGRGKSVHALEAEDIESRPVWKPMHMQPVFQDSRTGKQTGKKIYPCRVFGGAVSEDFYERGLCLPSGTAMTKNDLSRVVKIIIDVLGG